MARTTLSGLQSAIVAAIKSDAWFSGVPVIDDRGTQYNSFEKAMADEGIAVVVHPVETVGRIEGARGTTLVRASFRAEVSENPTRNSESLNKDLLYSSALVVRIVTELNQGPGEIHPEAESNLGELIVADDGLRGYELRFSKLVQLS